MEFTTTDVLADNRVRNLDVIRTTVGNQVASPVKALERPRIGPPSFEVIVRQVAVFQILVVHVGYLQLATSGRIQPIANIEHVGVIEVNPRYREIARRMLGLFDNPGQLPLLAELRNTEPALGRALP